MQKTEIEKNKKAKLDRPPPVTAWGGGGSRG